jgi:hypothetical protein
MYAPLGLPAKYKPIQSVEVAEAIPFHAAVSVPPAGTLVGLAVRLGGALPVTVKLLLALS